MKFKVKKIELMDALAVAVKAVATNPNVPIHSGMSVVARRTENGGEIEIRATNNDLYIVSKAKADVSEAGEAILSARYLYDFCRTFSGNEIAFEKEEEHNLVRLSCGPSSCELLTMEGEFPEMKRISPVASFSLNAGLLKNLINESVFSAAPENEPGMKVIFTGSLLEIADGVINVVATNTHRLALSSSPIEADGANAQSVIPARVLAEIGRSLEGDENVTIDLAADRAVFTFGENVISTGVINGAYPDYRRVIPGSDKLPITVTVGRDKLAQAVARTSIIAKNQNMTPYVCFTVGGGEVRLSSNNQAIGYAEDAVQAKIEGGEIEIAFNPGYVLDALKVMGGEKVQICLNAPLKPGVIRDPDNERYLCVITPIRMKN